MRTAKLKRRLRAAFGTVPEPTYFEGDMTYIRAYYDFRSRREPDRFRIDETTWNDLDMERLFKRINQKRCTSGEQYLYYQLRSPAPDRAEFDRRRQLIVYAQADPERRLRLEVILARLGCIRRADLCQAFYPAEHGIGNLIVYLLLLGVLLAAVVCSVLRVPYAPVALFLSLLLNCYIHEFRKRRIQRDYDTVNYIVSMIFAAQRLRRLRDPELDRQMAQAYASLDRLRSVIRTGGISDGSDNGKAADVILTITLLDLIVYEFLKNKLGRCHDDVFTVHEHLGRLDAAISVASYRAGAAAAAEPELCFDPGAQPRLQAVGMVHPLLHDPVPNDLTAERPILLTGSNASGKSTCLKTAALAAIMAQTICTVCARAYTATAFRIYSSMALRDDLLSGESYFITELKSLKRILDAADGGAPVLCVVDEVLRGTNTVERIAASSALLQAMAGKGVLCLAATHDLELCELLRGTYEMHHFTEQFLGDDMVFDYRLRTGPARSRNAIRLLELMGYDRQIVETAHGRADAYLAHGVWSADGAAAPE